MSFREVIIGPCRLINADCASVLPELNGVDAVITSPPYNCGKNYRTHNDSMSSTDYWAWIESVMHAATRTLNEHGYLCVNHANYIGSRDERELVSESLCPILGRCLPIRDQIIWNKGPANGAAWGNFRTSPRIRAQHENIYVCGGLTQMPPSDIEWDDWSRFTTSIWTVSTSGVDSTIHPAMMPVEIAYRLTMLYSPASGLIVDPFMGSGTTGIACIESGRRFVGIEIDPVFFESAVNRTREAWGESGLYADSKRTDQELFN